MAEKKYRLIKHKRMNTVINGQRYSTLYRLEALRDIPMYGVKAGDLGGWVTKRNSLSHNGNCWIGENAYVFGNAEIHNDAYVGGNAQVVSQSFSSKLVMKQAARVDGDAKVLLLFGHGDLNAGTTLSGKFHVTDEAEVLHLWSGTGNARIYGRAKVIGSIEITDSAEVYGEAQVNAEVKISGRSRIFGNAVVNKGAVIRDAVINNNMEIASYDTVSNITLQNDAIHSVLKIAATSVAETPAVNTAETVDYSTLDVFNEIKANIAAYETDIVKIIKHPIMTDRADPHTLQMIMALNKATRLSRKPTSPEFEEAVIALEEKFLTAESNALKIASTLLTEDERKKTEKAKDLLAIAANESSSENEKKVSFRQAFKQLEGVIAVPDIAVDTFRVKIGLKELES